MRKWLLLLCALAPLPVLAQNAVLLRADTLRAEPFADAKPVGQASAGDSFRIAGQKGTWSLLEGNGLRGWVRGLNLKTSATSAKPEGVLALQTGRQAQGGVSVPLAVRGLKVNTAASQLFKQLLDKRDPARTLRVSAAQSADGSLKVNLESDRSGYAYVFTAGEAGDSIQCLFPNAEQPDNDFTGGKPLVLSDSVTRNTGGRTREGMTVLAVLSEQPIDLALPDKQADGAWFRVPVTASNRAALAASLSGGCSTPSCTGYGVATTEVHLNR